MKRVLVITHDGEKLNKFVKDYFYDKSYATIYGEDVTIFDTTDTIVASVEPYTALVGRRFNEIYVDSNLLLDKDYSDSIEDALAQDKSSFVRGF